MFVASVIVLCSGGDSTIIICTARTAEVAELADALGSGPSGVKTLWRFESSPRHRRQTFLDERMTRQQMIDGQLRTWEVLDARVLAAYREVDRADFVAADSLRGFAFDEAQLPLGGGRFMLEPKLEARMLQAVAPGGDEKILHIGTGSGFFAALLGLMSGEVITMEIDDDLAKAAAARLAAFGARNVEVRCADGVGGLPDDAPFDAIVLTASSPILPPDLWHQVNNGGRLLAVIGDAPAMTLRLLQKRDDDVCITTDILETCIAPLVNAPQPPRFKF